MSSNRPKAGFEPAAYRQSIAEMFGGLDAEGQRQLIDRLAFVPRHIHRLATDGLIADQMFREPRSAVVSRRRAAS